MIGVPESNEAHPGFIPGLETSVEKAVERKSGRLERDETLSRVWGTMIGVPDSNEDDPPTKDATLNPEAGWATLIGVIDNSVTEGSGPPAEPKPQVAWVTNIGLIDNSGTEESSATVEPGPDVAWATQIGEIHNTDSDHSGTPVVPQPEKEETTHTEKPDSTTQSQESDNSGQEPKPEPSKGWETKPEIPNSNSQPDSQSDTLKPVVTVSTHGGDKYCQQEHSENGNQDIHVHVNIYFDDNKEDESPSENGNSIPDVTSEPVATSKPDTTIAVSVDEPETAPGNPSTEKPLQSPPTA